MNMECRRYGMQKKSAWAQANDLTPRGDKEYHEVFDGVNYREFSIVVVERDKSWECSMKRLHNTLEVAVTGERSEATGNEVMPTRGGDLC